MVSGVAPVRIMKLKEKNNEMKRKAGLDGLDVYCKPKSECREPESKFKSESKIADSSPPALLSPFSQLKLCKR